MSDRRGAPSDNSCSVIASDRNLMTGQQSHVRFKENPNIGNAPILRAIDEAGQGSSVGVLCVDVPDAQGAAVVADLAEECRERGISLMANIMLGTDADAVAALSAAPTSLNAVCDASRDLQTQGIGVRWLVPLMPELIHRLESLCSFAHDEGVEVVPVPAAFSSVREEGEPLSAEDRLFAWDFVTYRLLQQERSRISAAHTAYYRGLQQWLSDQRQSGETVVAPTVVLRRSHLGARQWELRCEERIHFALLIAPVEPDSSKPRKVHARFGRGAEVAGVLLDGLRGQFHWLLAQSLAPLQMRRHALSGSPLNNVIVIGAYGGEHIGDAAILGGVLLRVHKRFGTRCAVVMSQRPRHTRRLVSMLDVPMEVEVRDSGQSHVRACLHDADAVVFAGGPLTDLPKQLVRHLYTVSVARRLGKPFIVEGIGAGPFTRRPSAWVARRLVKMAQRVSVRTSDDGKHRLVRGLPVEVGHDPAFDYLGTRQDPLSKLAAREQAEIEQLIQGGQRPLIGVNIRPIRHEWTVGSDGHDRAAYTRGIEQRFEESFAKAIREYSRAHPSKPCFVFFPMNAIQFGLSDLRSAYRIKRLLGADVDFRVWQADASLDGVVSLLRHLDLVITMRFHATIFALSQGKPVIGIDYRIGRRDKVAALLGDFGQSENCCRIDEMTAAWLTERLRRLADSPIGQPADPSKAI